MRGSSSFMPKLSNTCGKLSKCTKKRCTKFEGQVLPLKKVCFFLFYIAMLPLGQRGVFPTGLFVFYDATLECYMPCSSTATPHSHSSFDTINPIIKANLILLNCLVFLPTLLLGSSGSMMTNSLAGN